LKEATISKIGMDVLTDFVQKMQVGEREMIINEAKARWTGDVNLTPEELTQFVLKFKHEKMSNLSTAKRTQEHENVSAANLERPVQEGLTEGQQAEVVNIPKTDPAEKAFILQNAQELLQDMNNKEISQSALVEMINEVSGEKSINQNHEHIEWATLAARAVNSVTPTVTVKVGEMFLQKSVYHSIAKVYYAFSQALFLRNQGSQFKADESVKCLRLVSAEKELCLVDIKPDAAITFYDSCYVIAMMELKAEVGKSRNDVVRSVIITSVSALALKEALDDVVEQGGRVGPYPLYFPFVIGRKKTATLYATRLNQNGTLNVVQICDAFMIGLREQHKKINLCAILCSLLAETATVVASLSSGYWEKESFIFDDFKNLPKLESSQKSSTKSEETKDYKSQSNPEAETHARRVASHHGWVQELRFPWLRIVQLFDQSNDDSNHQLESPFYFTGRIADHGTAVFCKVWREGDRHTKRQRIVEEIKFSRMANKLGVPSPKVIEELTNLDVIYTSKRNATEKYHILVTQKLPQDKVKQNDVPEYVLSLIRAVRALHDAGILHCDIKPDNVAWDSDQRQVFLLDFGHAQNVNEAKSYLGTRGYTAPEVIERKPHDMASDVFSVGKTLDSVMNESSLCGDTDGPLALVKSIIQHLTLDNPTLRMTLREAEDNLMAGMPKQSPLQKQTCHADFATVSPDSRKGNVIT